MEDPLVLDWSDVGIFMAGTAPAMILDPGDAVMARPPLDGTRCIRSPAQERGFTTLLAPSVATGWHMQGIRKIGDRLFVEHIALSGCV